MAKMNVGRQSLAQFQFVHHAEAGAIGKRPRLVAMFDDELACLLEAAGIHPFDSTGRGCEDRLEQGFHSMTQPTRLEQCDGFVQDIIRRHKPSTSPRRSRQNLGRAFVSRIALGPRDPGNSS